MLIPTFDADGYPTEDTENRLASWPMSDATGALDFLKAAWHWPNLATHDLSAAELIHVYHDPDRRYLRVVTGGWSGNEGLISAFHKNVLCWGLTWRVHVNGGLFIFRYPK